MLMRISVLTVTHMLLSNGKWQQKEHVSGGVFSLSFQYKCGCNPQ